jgi:hypothetical protein
MTVMQSDDAQSAAGETDAVAFEEPFIVWTAMRKRIGHAPQRARRQGPRTGEADHTGNTAHRADCRTGIVALTWRTLVFQCFSDAADPHVIVMLVTTAIDAHGIELLERDLKNVSPAAR